METKKRIEVSVETTDGKVVNIGDCVEFSAYSKTFIGKFAGIDNRGNWKFDGVIKPFEDVHFTIAPRSIDKMIKVRITAGSDEFPFMNPPESEEE